MSFSLIVFYILLCRFETMAGDKCSKVTYFMC